MKSIRVFVEGKDETYVLPMILKKANFSDAGSFIFDGEGGRGRSGSDAALEKFRLALKLRDAESSAIAVILDGNEEPEATWERVRQPIIQQLRDDPGPLAKNLEGLVLRPEVGPVFGAFLLPGKGSPGSVEGLLWDAADSDVQTCLKQQARDYVDAVEPQLFLSENERANSFQKAYLAAWLAVQHDPGIRSANAIDAEIISSQSDAILPLLGWLARLSDVASQNEEGIQP
jgi:hypothetical protein